MTNEKLLSPGPLLDSHGDLCQAGYATSLVREYDRSAVKASRWRIKEWDYYFVSRGSHGVALTVADNSYMSLVSVSVLDFDAPSYVTKSKMGLFTFGKVGLPPSSGVGDVGYSCGGADFAFLNDGETRQLKVHFPDFDQGKSFDCDITLTDSSRDSMVIATPFDKKAHFYYNQKINCLTASGCFSVGENTYSLDGGLGVLDWGRGVWTYRNTWYWSSLSTLLPDGRSFGFNLGYGFGDTSAASENMLFCDGVAHKLGQVTFSIPVSPQGEEVYTDTWHITSADGRLSLTMEPIIDRIDHASALIIDSNQHQVFGRFYGTAALDDGSIVTLDGQTGFAEKVKNRW